jgi:hypothetical protein
MISPTSYARPLFRRNCEIRAAGLVRAQLSQHVSGEIVIGKIVISIKPGQTPSNQESHYVFV